MARWIGVLNEGSLLRRTLLHVGTFVLGSLAFIALMSVLLVSIAKAILPPHNTARGEGDASSDSAEEASDTDGSGKSRSAPGTKSSRPKRPRSTPAAERDGESAE